MTNTNSLPQYPYQPFKQPVPPVPPDTAGEVCITFDRKWLPYIIGALKSLTVPQTYTDEIERATGEANNLLYEFIKADGCGDECIDYPPSSALIEWHPQNPFTEPDYTPSGFNSPPFYVVTDNILDLLWAGASKGDVLTGFFEIPIGNDPFDDFTVSPDRVGLARFRVNVVGKGTVELHLINVPNGGAVLIVDDSDITKFTWQELDRDLLELPPETSNIIVQERVFDTDGPHHVDVTFFPKVNDSFLVIGYGGGLRKINLCGFEEQMLDVMQSTTDHCKLLKRNGPSGEWVQFADLSLCQSPKNGPIQWKIQDGVLKYSTDGTNFTDYTDGNEDVFGQHEPSFPPDADKACIAAKSIVSVLRTQFQNFHDALAVGAALISVMALITAAVLVFVTAGAAAPLSLALASEVLAIGAVGIENNLTNAFWDNVECIIYTTIGSDGLFSSTEYVSFHDQLGALGTGGTILTMLTTIYGPVGLNNMVTSAGITSCDTAPCTNDPYAEMNFLEAPNPAFVSPVWQLYHTNTEASHIYRYGTVAGKWLSQRGYVVDITNNGISNWTTRVNIRIPITANIHVSRIEVDVYVSLDASLGGGQMGELSIWSPDSNKFAGKGLFKADFTTNQFTIVWSVTGGWNLQAGWEFEIWLISEVANYTQYHPPFGRADIQKVRLYS